ncbi:hypothetical protein F751_5078 [Auxenochlorella protothecoides]|uniref:Uncharacterized protein n=1 Tax=Auxenochlorella protothecoides TaxID=3075 RepID=A0A087SET2_AUXPR|nr:hypothetical protein F751_5078 [Auxenochlorella protothecoides]KFM24236.1 hypothetical protein F751_5078 [Auxenochlorella protothecoides]
MREQHDTSLSPPSAHSHPSARCMRSTLRRTSARWASPAPWSSRMAPTACPASACFTPPAPAPLSACQAPGS